MKPEVQILLTLSRVFGCTPYHQTKDGELRFSWLHWSTFRFLLVFLLHICHVVLAMYCLISTSQSKGIAMGAAYLSWLSFFSMNSMVQLILVIKSSKILQFLNITNAVFEDMSPTLKANCRQFAVKSFFFAFVIGFLIPIVTISLNFFHDPSQPIYTAWIFNGFSKDDVSTTSKILGWIFILGICTGGFMAVLISDYLPLNIAYCYGKKIESVNDSFRQRCVLQNREYHIRKTFKKTNQTPDEECKAVASVNSVVIRSTITEYLNIQRCLAVFNDSFALLIIVYLFQCFAMIIFLFFMVLRPGETIHYSITLMYFANGFQFLLRAIIGIHLLGRVQDEAKKFKQILLIDVGMNSISNDVGLMNEVKIFLDQIDDIGICAGSYLRFDPAFLVSFFGILTTYMAILIQSI